MSRAIDTASGNTIGIPSSDGAKIDDVVYGTAQVWVNFQGDGTVTVLDSYNVTSITDNATGDYTVNITTALADANYAVVTAISDDLGATVGAGANIHTDASSAEVVPTTSAFNLATSNTAGTNIDPDYVAAVVFGSR